MVEFSGTNLDLLFTLTGFAVWARLITLYIYGKPYLKLSPKPRYEFIDFRFRSDFY